ncbi:hypothetical protein pb186bvf_006231 [Paramecium bursaria]
MNCNENYIYYQYQDPLIHQREVSLIKRINLFNRCESYATDTQFFKMKKIQNIRNWIFVLTHNQIIREEMQGDNQKSLALNYPVDFIIYQQQIIILQEKELNFFDVDLVKIYTIKLVEWVFEIQNNLNYLLLSGHSSLVVIDLLNVESIEKFNICLQGFDYISSISEDLLVRLSLNGFGHDSYTQINVFSKRDSGQNFSLEYDVDGIAFLDLQSRKIIFHTTSNLQRSLFWSMKYKIN